MAKHVTVSLVDDMDPTLSADRTLPFSFDKEEYEIDLSEQNQARFYAAVRPFITHARKVGSNAGTSIRRRKHKPTAEEVAERNEIRAWARAQGHEVSDFGRIPADILELWENAQQVSA